jgi:hypothetical protein
MLTRSSMATACLVASLLPMPRCLTSTSVNWVETFRNGFSEVIGSWKIIDISAPRRRSSRSSRWPRISCPRSLTLPEAAPFLASSPMIAIRIWLLPEPDSPTMPTVSPGQSDRLTSLTAATVPPSVRNWTRRSLISRIGGRAAKGCSVTAADNARSVIYRSFGSKASRKPSAMKFRLNRVSARAHPGNNS